MKFTVSNRLNPSLLGERKIDEYSFKDSTGESNDGMRRSFTYTVHCKIFGNITNEIKNEDGTYTYDYISRAQSEYGDTIRNPKESKMDLKTMVEELMFQYNIHNFSTELQEEPNDIKNYYVSMNTTFIQKLNNEPYFSYSLNLYEKNRADYISDENTQVSIYQNIKSESINEVNKKLNNTLSKEEYILYLLGNKIEKNFIIKMGLDEIGENETLREFLNKISLKNIECKNLEEALDKKIISIQDIKEVLPKHSNLSPINISNNLLEQLFNETPELIQYFYQREMPTDILRKYSPNFDIKKVNPSDLLPNDLDNVLENVIQTYYICGIYGGPSEEELRKGYMDYLKTFYDDPDALKKIIPVLNTAEYYFFRILAENFVKAISPEVLGKNEIRDILLDTKNIELSQILKYKFNYDKKSAEKLLELLRKQTSRIHMDYLNDTLKIIKENGINNEEIVEALRINGFNFYLGSGNDGKKEIQEFKELGIQGMTLDDLRDRMLKSEDFNYLMLVDEITPEEMTREYNNILNELMEKKNIKGDKKYEGIFEIMCEYQNSSELFSRLTPNIKELSKKIMIENLDVIEKLQKAPINRYSKFSQVMNVMSEAFEITEEDMKNIYMKCLNNGVSKEEIINELKQYIPEADREEFKKKIENSNIYPNPKYFWLTDKNLKRIGIKRGENRNTIKSKIQADGKCFSTKIKTDMVGESKDGKKVVVNNLSKWLFGVPGARGNLTITKAGDYIQLPGNTPEEAVKLIENILEERTKEGESK